MRYDEAERMRARVLSNRPGADVWVVPRATGAWSVQVIGSTMWVLEMESHFHNWMRAEGLEK